MGLHCIALIVRYFFTFTHLHLHSTPSLASDTSADVERKLSGASHHRRRWVAAYPPAQHHYTSHPATMHFATHFATTSHIIASYHRISHRIIASRIATSYFTALRSFDLDNMSLHCINAKDFDLCLARHSFAAQPPSSTSLFTIHSNIQTLASSRLRGEDSTSSVVELLHA